MRRTSGRTALFPRWAAACLAVLCLMVCASCTSLSLEMKAQNEGLPVWVFSYDPPEGRMAFMGTGTDADVQRAGLKAYVDISNQLAEYLGAELTDDQFRELTSTSAISAFSLIIQNRAEKTVEGETTVYLLAVGSSSRLARSRSAVALEREQLINDLDALVLSAQECYQTERDVDAVKTFLKTAAIAYENDVTTISTDALITRVVNLIDNLQIRMTGIDASRASCRITVQRRYVILPSDIVNATIRATLSAGRGDGEVYQESYVFATGSSGYFDFLSPNGGLVNKGTVSFSLDLGEEYEYFKSVMPDSSVLQIEQSLRKKDMELEYELKSPFSGKQLALCVSEYNETGDALAFEGDLNPSTLMLSGLLAADGIETAPFDYASDDDDEDFYAYAASAVEGCTHVIRCDVAIGQVEEAGGRFWVIANGSLSISTADGRVLDESGTVQTIAGAGTRDQAIREAFDLYVRIAFSRIRTFIYF